MKHSVRTAPPVELRVIRGEVIDDTLHGDIVVANEALACRQASVCSCWRTNSGTLCWATGNKWCRSTGNGCLAACRSIEGVGQPLGWDASALAHRQEFAADACGLRAVRTLGLSDQDAVAAVMDLGMCNETATHPGARKRVAALRSIEPDQLQAAAPSAAEH